MRIAHQDDLDLNSYTLHHPAPEGPKIEHLPLQPVDHLPAGISIGDWLEKEERGWENDENSNHQIYEGVRKFHLSTNGKSLIPGSLVYKSDNGDTNDFPEKGMVVECPDRPYGAEFDCEYMRYDRNEAEGFGRTPTVGVVRVSNLNSQLLSYVKELATNHVNSAIPQLVYDDVNQSSVKYTDSSTLTWVKNINHVVDVESLWMDDMLNGISGWCNPAAIVPVK